MRPLLLAGLLLVAPAALAAPAAPPADARAQKELGDQRRKAGDAAGALEAYRAALQRFGGYAEAYEATGEVQYGQKRFADAITSFGYAVEIDPAYALAWYNMAFAARKAGDLPRARGAYERYVKLRPTDPDGHYGLAETLRGLDERDAAAREYQLFIDLAKAIPAQAAWVEKARGQLAALRAPPPTAPAPVPAPAQAPAPEVQGGTAAAVLGAAGAVAATAAPPASAAAAAGGSATVDGAPAAAVAPAGAVPTAPPMAAPTVIPTATAAPTPTPTPTPTPAVAEPIPSQALIDKLGAGDRAWLAGDHRAALFLYQDATYLEPAASAARIRLARAYAALRHPEQAEAQLRQVLAQYPDHAEARKALEELRSPPPRATPLPVPTPSPAGAPGPSGTGAGGRVYKFTPEAEAPPPAGPPAARPSAAAPTPTLPAGEPTPTAR